MGLLGAIISWIIFGFIAGAIARFLVPGRQPMSFFQTMALGIVGSLAGGFVAWLFTGGSPLQPSGFVLSILGATGVLAFFVYRARKRETTVTTTG